MIGLGILRLTPEPIELGIYDVSDDLRSPRVT